MVVTFYMHAFTLANSRPIVKSFASLDSHKVMKNFVLFMFMWNRMQRC